MIFTIEKISLCHPGGSSGYKISSNKKSIVYALDHEFGLDKDIDNSLLKIASNSDVVIWDGMYTMQEIKDKKGWGHSSIEHGVIFHKKSKAKRIIYFTSCPRKK